MNIIEMVSIVILGSVGSLITLYLKPYVDSFLKMQRDKRLERNKKAREAFEKEVAYYLERPDGRIEVLLRLNHYNQDFFGYLLLACILFIFYIMTSQSDNLFRFSFLFLFGTGFSISLSLYSLKKAFHQEKVFSEVINA